MWVLSPVCSICNLATLPHLPGVDVQSHICGKFELSNFKTKSQFFISLNFYDLLFLPIQKTDYFASLRSKQGLTCVTPASKQPQKSYSITEAEA